MSIIYKFDIRDREGRGGCYWFFDPKELLYSEAEGEPTYKPEELIDLVCLAKNINLYNGNHIIFGIYETIIQSDECPTWIKFSDPKNLILLWNGYDSNDFLRYDKEEIE